MFLTITGKLGSGKSTICRLLADNYGFEICSAGEIQRRIANDMRISTLELNRLMMNDPSLDELIDREMVNISLQKKEENVVFDSRMAFHFISNSFDVFTTIDPREAANKVMDMPRGDEEVYQNLESAEQLLLERGKLENERFIETYRVDNFDYTNFDFVIDTTWNGRKEIADLIFKAASSYPEDQNKRILMSPKSLYPVKPLNEVLSTDSWERQPCGMLHSEPIRVFQIGDYHYIADERSHVAVLEALKKKFDFVRVQIAGSENCPVSCGIEDFFYGVGKKSEQIWQDYEKWGEFKYKSYPHLP